MLLAVWKQGHLGIPGMGPQEWSAERLNKPVSPCDLSTIPLFIQKGHFEVQGSKLLPGS